MVIVTSIQIDPSTVEEINEMVQNVSTGSSLDLRRQAGPANRWSSSGS